LEWLVNVISEKRLRGEHVNIPPLHSRVHEVSDVSGSSPVGFVGK
jgi:hypothetical protein